MIVISEIIGERLLYLQGRGGLRAHQKSEHDLVRRTANNKQSHIVNNRKQRPDRNAISSTEILVAKIFQSKEQGKRVKTEKGQACGTV